MSKKYNAALGAYEIIKQKEGPLVLGIGTGSTTDYFTKDFLLILKDKVTTLYSSSVRTTKLLLKLGFQVSEYDPNNSIDIYIDGADEVDKDLNLIKGGGGAHTREKIVAASSKEFICIVDKSKLVKQLGNFPLPIEVIPESRSMVARKIVALGGTPEYRNGFITDQGNEIIDVKDLEIPDPEALEIYLNNIPGVVDNGIFAFNKPSTVLVSD